MRRDRGLTCGGTVAWRAWQRTLGGRAVTHR